MNKDEAFMSHLIEIFKIEAEEHLSAMTLLLVALEKAEDPLEETEQIETVFREAHSLKGAARAVNLKEVEKLCQALESIFNQMKRKTLKTSTDIFDLLLEAVDFLSMRLESIELEPSSEDQATGSGLLYRLEHLKPKDTESCLPNDTEQVRAAEPVPQEAAVEAPDPIRDEGAVLQTEADMAAVLESAAAAPATGTLRVSSSRLSSVLLQSEEMLLVKLSSALRVREMKAIVNAYPQWKKEWTKIFPALQEFRAMVQANADGNQGGADSAQVRSLNRVLEFIDWNSNFTKNTEAAIRDLHKTAKRDNLVLEGMVDTLLEDMKKVTMFPFSSLLEIIPKAVRDLSKDSGRKTDLEIRGGDIEIDRRILDEMRDPVMHLIRNCIDHGIEKPEERKRKNKPAAGRIIIDVFPRDRNVELVIADDGAGISAEKVRSAMQKSGTLPLERIQSLSDRELISYVFHSGVSTSPMITELSGRGLGLAIVREKVEKLGGSITLETVPDVGSEFHIVLPLTIATFRGILISAGNQDFILPAMYVERVMRIKPEELQTVENRETILLNGCPVSLARLSSVLGMMATEQLQDGYLQLVVLTVTGMRIAFLIDSVHHEQEVLFKSLGPQLTRIRNISGATVLGSGHAVPILNVPDLMKSAVLSSGSAMPVSAIKGMTQTEKTAPSILVAEDSITTRTLLKNILETAGYSVQTATDGLDALMKLKSGQYDAVLSDVDMPRMNGFDLTDSIRKNNATRNLPVILITALASREDQERGIDVGANAYIVKSMFDQNNLLDVLKRLIARGDEQ